MDPTQQVLMTCGKLMSKFSLVETTSEIKNRNNKSKWALISGASDGIGLEFAMQLAGKGFNIILVGRNVIKLNAVEKVISNEYKNIKILSLVVDFSSCASSKLNNFYDNLTKLAKDLNIELIINNVGCSYEHPTFLTENSLGFYNSMINCNVFPVVNITYLFLNEFFQKYPLIKVDGKQQKQLNQNQKQLTILNVSSVLAEIPAPLLSIYGASKAFVSKFSNDLKREILISHGTDSNIKIHTIQPWLVSTKMSRSKPSIICPTAAQYANHIIHTGRYIPHDIISLLLKMPIIGWFIQRLIVFKFLNSYFSKTGR